MIEQIFIHIGVHKTGSTTIQESLGRKSEALKSYSFLYPVFRSRKADIFNHSVPFVSMFRDNPESYLDNRLNGITTQAGLVCLHQNYELQLTEQIGQFNGNKLIISGEGICTFTIDQLGKLKSFLKRLTPCDVEMQIVMFCRNSVQQIISHTSAIVRSQGLTLKNCLPQSGIHNSYYRQIVLKFIEVFGKENITILRFEDAILHPSGITGALLEAIGAETALISQFKNERFNPASSSEAVSIFSAIHETLPAVDGLPYSFQGKTRKLLMNLLGQKFVLPVNVQRKVWELTKVDADWLCATFSLPYYQYKEEEIPAITGRWGAETIKYLHQVMLSLPDPVKKTILDVLLDELKAHKREFSLDKRRELFGFIMHYSLYLQTGSWFKKFKYLVKKLGVPSGVLHGSHYFLLVHLSGFSSKRK